MLRFLIALLLIMAGSDVWAQGIGDAAKREREKRKAADPAKEHYVYDNSDLRKEEPSKSEKDKDKDKDKADASGQEPANSAPAVEPDSGPTEYELRAARIAEAEQEVAAAEGRLAELQAKIKALQDRLNPMSPSFVYGQPSAADPMAAEARAKDELAQAEAALPAAQQAIEDARKAVDDARAGRQPEERRPTGAR